MPIESIEPAANPQSEAEFKLHQFISALSATADAVQVAQEGLLSLPAQLELALQQIQAMQNAVLQAIQAKLDAAIAEIDAVGRYPTNTTDDPTFTASHRLASGYRGF